MRAARRDTGLKGGRDPAVRTIAASPEHHGPVDDATANDQTSDDDTDDRDVRHAADDVEDEAVESS